MNIVVVYFIQMWEESRRGKVVRNCILSFEDNLRYYILKCVSSKWFKMSLIKAGSKKTQIKGGNFHP